MGAAKPKRITPASLQGQESMNEAIQELADMAMKYPFRWFAQGKVAILCGFGENVLRALAEAGAPIVARKCNPHLLHKWLMENSERVGKIRMP